MAVTRNGGKMGAAVEQAEGLAQELIDQFVELLSIDEEVYLSDRAMEDIPESIEEKLRDRYRKLVDLCDRVIDFMTWLREDGYGVQGLHKIKKVRSYALRLTAGDDAFHRSEAYRELVQQALAEYRPRWPRG